MSKIDISKWGEFKISELFKLVNSKPYHNKDVTIDRDSSNTINYVTRSKFNNGLNNVVVLEEHFEINPAGVISFGAENADFFYQPEQYIAGNKMYYIDTRYLSFHSCLYIKTILQASFSDNYSFNHGLTATRLRKETIKLPQKNGEPDWEYMGKYMKKIEKKAQNQINNFLTINEIEAKPFNINSWGEFRLKDLFDTITQGERVKKADQIDGDLPFVMAGFKNHGISKHIANEVFIYPSNAITMDVFGNVFYRDYKFGASDDVGVYYNTKDSYTSYQMLFIATAFQKKIGELAFNNKIRASKTHDILIPLPQKNNEPDWEYMEKNMKRILAGQTDKLNRYLDFEEQREMASI